MVSYAGNFTAINFITARVTYVYLDGYKHRPLYVVQMATVHVYKCSYTWQSWLVRIRVITTCLAT